MKLTSHKSCGPESIILIVLLSLSLNACMKASASPVLPRDQSLPLFKPHTATFICVAEATKLPPIDAIWMSRTAMRWKPGVSIRERACM